MHNMCTASGKACVNAMEKNEEIYTLSTNLFFGKKTNPQTFQILHNFSTQISTTKSTDLTGVLSDISTESTYTITTTTII